MTKPAVDWSSLRNDVHHLGWSRAAVRAVYYRLQHIADVRLYRLLVLLPETLEQRLLHTPLPYPCREIGYHELSQLAQDPANSLQRSRLDTALARGDVCVGIINDDHLANQGWYTRNRTVVDPPVSVGFDPGYLYMYAGYTRPEYRGRNLHALGLAQALELLRQRDCLGFVTIAEHVNYASRRAARRVGFRDVGLALRVGLGLRRIWHIGGTSAYGFNLRYDSNEGAAA